MDISRLRYFVVTAEERSISRAAERLHITQPPLTRHIQSLEKELGVPLFNRTSGGVELTEVGKTVLSHARAIRTQVEQATAQVRKVARGQAGRIDIGVYGSAMLDSIPKILGAYSSSHPDVEVVLHVASRGKQIESLHRGRLLIAFDRYLPDTPELHCELVCRETLWVALNRNDPLARRPEISLEDLRASPLIGEQDPCVYPTCRALFRHYDFEPRVAHKAVDMISAVAMVAGGFGSAFVPESVLNVQLPSVVYRPLHTDVECFIDLHCAYRRNEQSPLLRSLLDCIHGYHHQNPSRMSPASLA
ncbi:LysR family transcriptional regulator [Propionivibrio sp.]|uniref:LysR family transcriptional regulator n=1 Tax=Propionivibrio sp. TaxID=2212460 RepID=UPI0039E3BBBB